MANQAATQARESVVSRLALFFPGGMPLRIPVRVTAGAARTAGPQSKAAVPHNAKPHKDNSNGDGRQELSENTVIEYGTAREVLFASALPLEFEDRIHLETSDGSLTADADVVAVQYHEGKMAVAVRFRSAIPNWIIKH